MATPIIDINVKDITAFKGPFPNFREPKELGTFSLDGERKYCADNRNLKYYSKPGGRIHMNLSAGYHKAVHKDDTSKNEKLDSILTWILANRNKLIKEGNSNLSTDFVCYRGLLTLLLVTPYESREDWIICATKYNGTIYLLAFDTDNTARRNAKMSKREKLMTSWGFKFEQYVTADSPTSAPTTKVPVNENEEYCSVCTSKLGDNGIVYGAEVDCVDPALKDSGTTKRYVELKTSRKIMQEKQDRNFRKFKLLKWWSQSFLIGIPKIVCGFRDDDGYILHVHDFEVKAIPKMATEFWDPCVCFNFCNQFLSHVRKYPMKDNPRVVYKYTWSPGDSIRCEELTDAGKYQILPEWYISQIFQ